MADAHATPTTPTTPATLATHATLVAVFREEAGRLASALLRILDDFDVAEEIVQDALLVALERWPVEGIPERPGAWLLTVARHRALNRLVALKTVRTGAHARPLHCTRSHRALGQAAPLRPLPHRTTRETK